MGNEQLLKEIGARINARRRELKITQELLAEKMDVSIQMISNLELGKKAIRPENLVNLCNVLQVSADYILFGRHSEHEMNELVKRISQLSPKKQDILFDIINSWEK